MKGNCLKVEERCIKQEKNVSHADSKILKSGFIPRVIINEGKFAKLQT